MLSPQISAPTIEPKREQYAGKSTTKILLACGLISSILYIITNIITVKLYDGYNALSQTVSELSAIAAPTRVLWVNLVTVYSLLIIVFAWGIWKSSGGKKSLKVTAVLFLSYALIGFFWPPMHQREVLAAGGKSLTDTLHIVFTAVNAPFMIATVGFGAAAFGRKFRLYSAATIVLMLFFGILTSLDAPKMEANLATPLMGLWERISIGVHIIWIAVFSMVLLRSQRGQLQIN